MPKQPTHKTGHQAPSGEEGIHVSAIAVFGRPVEIVPAADAQPEEFTREYFEGALDKVSRPVKGKYAHIPYSSEDFIRDKREEAELEDRPS